MLMQTRYENIEEFVVDVDKELYNCQCIKLIFQPIVENAIYHGLDSLESGGQIKLTGYKDNGDIVFEIYDNGAGMTEEQTHLLNGYVNDLNDNFNSIGLKNVNMRIKLQYGAAYGLLITSNKETGTTGKVRLPYKPS